jgi:hypothetical protein
MSTLLDLIVQQSSDPKMNYQLGWWLEGPPQELMRRWGRVTICKASRPNHKLGIRTHATLLRKEIKELI